MRIQFSVLIPVHNREEHVRQAIESVLAQTFKNYELIVVDDGSTDGTPAALASYGSCIQVLRQANQGPEVARNLATAHARGEYLVLLDSDDLLYSSALATYDQVIRLCGAPPLILGAMSYFAEGHPAAAHKDGREGAEVLIFDDYLSKDVGIGLSNSRIVIRKSVFEEIGGVRKSTPSTFHLDDFNLVLKAGTQSPCVLVQKPFTVAYRMHATNSIHNHESIGRGILSVIESERNGCYPGDVERRGDRFACIGGIAGLCAWKSLKARRLRLASKLLVQSSPMLAVAIYKKLISRFCDPQPAVILNDRTKLPQFRHDLKIGNPV